MSSTPSFCFCEFCLIDVNGYIYDLDGIGVPFDSFDCMPKIKWGLEFD